MPKVMTLPESGGALGPRAVALASQQQQLIYQRTDRLFAGLMLFDKHSFLNADPGFQPIKQFRSAKGQFGIAELLKQSILA